MTATTRVCSLTGFALTSSPNLTHRIARESYGPISPPFREPGSDPRAWSRFDTPGRTIYLSADRLTAYMELLAPYRAEVNARRKALEPAANSLGLALQDYWDSVVADWDRSGHMKVGWLPGVFREGRRIYSLVPPEGWWIDVTAMETITALHAMFDGTWPTSAGATSEPLTVSQLTSDDRVLTTAIASAIRDSVTLDDGSLPLGLRFISKHGRPAGGTGVCWAYWMRQADEGLDEPLLVTADTSIDSDDEDFSAALQHCGIYSR